MTRQYAPKPFHWDWRQLNSGYLLRSTPEPVHPTCSLAIQVHGQWQVGCNRVARWVKPANDFEWVYPPWQPYDWFACHRMHRERVDMMLAEIEIRHAEMLGSDVMSAYFKNGQNVRALKLQQRG